MCCPKLAIVAWTISVSDVVHFRLASSASWTSPTLAPAISMGITRVFSDWEPWNSASGRTSFWLKTYPMLSLRSIAFINSCQPELVRRRACSSTTNRDSSVWLNKAAFWMAMASWPAKTWKAGRLASLNLSGFSLCISNTPTTLLLATRGTASSERVRGRSWLGRKFTFFSVSSTSTGLWDEAARAFKDVDEIMRRCPRCNNCTPASPVPARRTRLRPDGSMR